MNKNFYIAIVVLVMVISVSFGSDFLLQKSKGAKSDFAEENSLSLPVKSYKTSELYQELLVKCPDNSFSCFQDSSKDITKNYGPKASLEVLKMLQDNRLVDITIDDHQYAHIVGRDTAHLFGVNPPAFLSCPTTFNYGCQHGYFEASLVMVKPAKKAIDLICGALDNQYSTKFKFYCYHGVGHGVMDAQAYDLKASLDLCDTLDDPMGQDGCWQGAFMENVNAGMRGEAKKDIFSQTDPLAPCNKVDEKYRQECFINHSGWLMIFFKNDIKKASASCLKAPGNYDVSCLNSLGLLTTNPSWQYSMTGNNDFNKNVRTALQLCDQFPKNGRISCFTGAVDNILNYDDMDLGKRAVPFCKTVQGWDGKDCYRQIGINIQRQVVDFEERKRLCETVESDYQTACEKGAGI